MTQPPAAALAVLRSMCGKLDDVLAGQLGGAAVTRVTTEVEPRGFELELATTVASTFVSARSRRIPCEALDHGGEQVVRAIVDNHYRPLTDMYTKAIRHAFETWEVAFRGETPQRYVLVADLSPYVYGPFATELAAVQARAREEFRRYPVVRPALIMPLAPEDGRRG